MTPSKSQPLTSRTPTPPRTPTPEPVSKTQATTSSMGYKVTSVAPSQEASVAATKDTPAMENDISTQKGRVTTEIKLRFKRAKDAYELGQEADHATQRLLKFKESCQNAPDKEAQFWAPGGLGTELESIKKKCWAIYLCENPNAPLAEGIANIQCKPKLKKAYDDARARAISFLGSYSCVSAESTATTLLGHARASISQEFSGTAKTREYLGKVFNHVASDFITGLTCFTHCQKLSDCLDGENTRKLKAKIACVMPIFYIKVASLYTNSHMAIAQVKEKHPQTKAFPADTASETLKLLQTIFKGFNGDTSDKALLEADQYFAVSPEDKRKPEVAIELYCSRILMGAISGQFELTRTSMRDMARFCTETCQHEKELAEPKSKCLDFPAAVLDVSLLIATQLSKQEGNVINIQTMRLKAIDLLTNLKTCWETFYPAPKRNSSPRERRRKLDTLLSQIQKDMNGTVKRAIKALEAVTKLKQASSTPKKTTVRSAGTVVSSLCESEITPFPQDDTARATASPPLTERAIKINWETLKEAAEKIKSDDRKDCFRLYQQVLNCAAQNSTPEQRVLAHYGTVELYFMQATEAYHTCQQSFTFLNKYFKALQEPNLPSSREGKQFQEMVQSFRNHFQEFSINIALVSRFQKNLEKEVLLSDSELADNQDLQEGFHWIKEDCCEYIRKLNEPATALPAICELRKKRLQGMQASQQSEDKQPYSYEDALKGISGYKQSLNNLLPSFEQGFEIYCGEETPSTQASGEGT